jgi:hypothetical protein
MIPRICLLRSSGPVADFMAMGKDCGDEIRANAGEQFFVDLQAYVQNIQAANEKPVKA